MKAIYKKTIIAESDSSIVVEGNHYFPPNAVRFEYLDHSSAQSTCPWKGIASYYHIKVDDQASPNSAWTYPEPSEAAAQIKDYVAFWGDVSVVSS